MDLVSPDIDQDIMKDSIENVRDVVNYHPISGDPTDGVIEDSISDGTIDEKFNDKKEQAPAP